MENELENGIEGTNATIEEYWPFLFDNQMGMRAGIRSDPHTGEAYWCGDIGQFLIHFGIYISSLPKWEDKHIVQ